VTCEAPSVGHTGYYNMYFFILQYLFLYFQRNLWHIPGENLRGYDDQFSSPVFLQKDTGRIKGSVVNTQ
jgi:hypothetical protein